MLQLTVESLASLLADAHRDGWEEGSLQCPEPDMDRVFLKYLNEYQDVLDKAILDECPERVMH